MWIVVVLCILLLTPFWLLLGFWAYAEASHVVDGEKIRRQMARCGRVVRIASLSDKLTRGDGTLIVEGVSVGFPWSRLWWTEDNVDALAPMTPLTAENFNDATSLDEKQRAYHFESWVDITYLDLENGKAKLVRARRGRQTLETLRKRFPNLEGFSIAPFLLQMELESAEDSSDGNAEKAIETA